MKTDPLKAIRNLIFSRSYAPINSKGEKSKDNELYSKRKVLLLTTGDPRHDPRHSWIANFAPSFIRIHQVGTTSDATEERLADLKGEPSVRIINKRQWDETAARQWIASLTDSHAAVLAFNEIFFINDITKQDREELLNMLGASTETARLGSFIFNLRQLRDMTATLVEACRYDHDVSAIIASDLFSLPAALILSGMLGVGVLYDAHEYMAEIIPEYEQFEVKYWSNLEGRLVSQARYCQTVSEPLAAFMTNLYSKNFISIPNAVPRTADTRHQKTSRRDGSVHFIFSGLFGSGRGLEQLIDCWGHTPSCAILRLQGPANEYRTTMIERSRDLGLLDSRIYFPDAVPEADIQSAMAEADVGVIPYEGVTTNNRFCCPNKLSQYMSVGLPILANETVFVGNIISVNRLGEVANFQDQPALVGAITRLCEDHAKREAAGARALKFFLSTFNWQSQSRQMYLRLNILVEQGAFNDA
ncbi:glycosyltransferase [Methylobacterium sp. A49B]